MARQNRTRSIAAALTATRFGAGASGPGLGLGTQLNSGTQPEQKSESASVGSIPGGHGPFAGRRDSGLRPTRPFARRASGPPNRL